VTGPFGNRGCRRVMMTTCQCVVGSSSVELLHGEGQLSHWVVHSWYRFQMNSRGWCGSNFKEDLLGWGGGD
jgi:hypothetical protein